MSIDFVYSLIPFWKYLSICLMNLKKPIGRKGHNDVTVRFEFASHNYNDIQSKLTVFCLFAPTDFLKLNNFYLLNEVSSTSPLPVCPRNDKIWQTATSRCLPAAQIWQPSFPPISHRLSFTLVLWSMSSTLLLLFLKVDHLKERKIENW